MILIPVETCHPTIEGRMSPTLAPAYPPPSSCWREPSGAAEASGTLLWLVPSSTSSNPTPCKERKKSHAQNLGQAMQTIPCKGWRGVYRQANSSIPLSTFLQCGLPIPPILPFRLCPSLWLPSHPMQSNYTLPSNPHTTPSWLRQKGLKVHETPLQRR